MTESELNQLQEVKEESQRRDKKLYDALGFRPAEVIAAGLEYDAFIQRLNHPVNRSTKENGASWLHVPLARKAFIIGYCMKTKG